MFAYDPKRTSIVDDSVAMPLHFAQQKKPVNPTDQQKKPVNPTDQAVSLGQFGEWGTLSSNAWRQENLLRALKAGFSYE
jgi:hypothetical protein